MAFNHEKTPTPSDLTPIMAMHADLKETIHHGLASLRSEIKALNLTHIGLAKDIEYIKDSLDKHEHEISRIREVQLACPSATNFQGTLNRINRLENFSESILQSGILSPQFKTPSNSLPAVQVTQTSGNTTAAPIYDKVAFDKFLRVSLVLLLGAALGGALLASTLFFN